MRALFQGTAKDGNGKVLSGASITVYLAGTTTLASIYTTLTGTTAVNSTTSSESGYFAFYVDRFTYDIDQKFKIIISLTGFTSQTYDNLEIDQIVLGTYTISTAKTISTHIVVPKGVVFTFATGGSMAFTGIFEAGLYQVFSGFSAGNVTFSAGAVKEVYPEWWTTNTTPGTTDMTTAIQSAANSLPATGGIIFFLNTTYKRTVKTTLQAGTIIQGSGSLGSVVKDYTDGQDGFYALNKTGIVIRNIQLYDAIYSTTRATGHGINLDGTGGYAGFEIDDVYIIGYQDGIHGVIVGYSTINKVRAVLQIRDSFSITGASSTSIVMNAPISSSAGRYSFYGTNVYDIVLNSPIGDDATSDTFHFEDSTTLTVNSPSAENDTGSGNAYYLKSCEYFTFNSPRSSKAGITNGFYFDRTCRYGKVNNAFINSPSSYGIYVDNSVTQSQKITFENPNIATPGVGEIYDTLGAIKRVYPHYEIKGSFTNPYTFYTSTGNGAGVETTLTSFTLPAGTMDPISHSTITRYECLKIVAWGTFAANGNAKTVTLYWNTTEVIGQITGNFNNKHWRIEANIGIDTFAQEYISSHMVTNDNATFPASTTFTSSVLDIVNNSSLIKITGNGAGASDVVLKGFFAKIE